MNELNFCIRIKIIHIHLILCVVSFDSVSVPETKSNIQQIFFPIASSPPFFLTFFFFPTCGVTLTVTMALKKKQTNKKTFIPKLTTFAVTGAQLLSYFWNEHGVACRYQECLELKKQQDLANCKSIISTVFLCLYRRSVFYAA